MAVIIQTTSSTSSSTGSITITKPTGTVDGDLLILVLNTDHSASGDAVYSIPSGWTSLVGYQRTDNTLAGVSYQSWYKIASSEAANYACSNDISRLIGGCILRIDGHHATTPIDVTPGTSVVTSGEPLTPSITTVTDNCLILLSVTWDESKTKNSIPSGYTESYHIDISGLDQEGAYKTLASAGATGTGQYDISASTKYVANTIAIRPVSVSTVVKDIISEGLIPFAR